MRGMAKTQAQWRRTHKWVQLQVYTDSAGTPIQNVIDQLMEFAGRLEEPVVRVVSDDDSWDGIIYVQGWRPLTDAEKRMYKAASERAKAAAEKRKAKNRERAEREYERLRKALGKDD